MSNNHSTCFAIFGLLLTSTAIAADLPSLGTETSALGETRIRAIAVSDGFDLLPRGRVQWDFAALDYRFSRDGLDSKFGFAGTVAHAVLKYSGDHRIESEWRVNWGSVKAAYAAENGIRGFRLEFARKF